MTPPPDPAELAALLARHAPAARRFLAWEAGPHLATLLAAARHGTPDWVMGIEPSEAAIAPLLATLPQDPCLHLRALPPFEPPPEGWAHPLLRPALQGLRPDVILLPGPTRAWAARAALRALAPGGLLLIAAQPASDLDTLRPVFDVLDHGATLTALRPRHHTAIPTSWPRGDHAVVVLVVGDQVGAEWEITGPSVAAYAAAIGATLHILRDGRGLPSTSLKSLAVDVAMAHDRIIMLDADILIRPHAPDLFGIVPPDAIGAYPEGEHYQRAGIVEDLVALHGVAPFPPQHYVNAGMMVLSRAHLGVLAALSHGTIGGRIPEQDTVNAALRRLGAPLHRLTPEFNLIANGSHLADWRCGWLLHTAGAPKPAYRRRFLWQREALPNGAVWTERPLRGRALRLPHLAAQANRIAGRETRALDPDDMTYAQPHAMARLMPGGLAAIWIAAGQGDDPVATGRIEGLSPGRWRIAAMPLPGVATAPCRIQALQAGHATSLPATEADGALLLDLPDGVAAIDVALQPGPAEMALAGLLATRAD
ncbi:hypothetical protein AAFN86_20985 [Roseomonas sp. CAU 1739]|uniref:hypothetical protein n=1 Tax=Roseomonas sp. CAU 1739 TaxID=3140364 RepID=UPI00325A7DA0